MRCLKKGGDRNELLHNNVGSDPDVDAHLRNNRSNTICSKEHKKIIASACTGGRLFFNLLKGATVYRFPCFYYITF